MKTVAISLKACTSLFCVLLSIQAISQSETFTTSGTFTIPAGVTSIDVETWGAGGGGSDRSANSNGGGNGGAGGGYAGGTLAVTPGDILNIIIGAAGTKASNNNGADGSAGGDTFVVNSSTSDKIQANGGAGGVVGESAGGAAATGGSTVFFGTVANQVSYKGGDGGIGNTSQGGGGGGGAGSSADGTDGGTLYGGTGGPINGGNGGNGGNNKNGGNGINYGGGGGAAGDHNTGTGGNGAPGLAILSWTVPPEPEINVTGNGSSIIGDGTNAPILSDNTNFGQVQIVSETATKTFVIENTGTADLTIGTITLSGSSEFTINSAPAASTVLAPNATANVVISFYTSSIGIQTDILTINSDDNDEAVYQINLTADADKVFFDSDNDGVYDDVDVDDDNDGIIDSDEENACRLSNGASQADYKFLNETFGTGTTRTTINSFYNAYTSYCYEDGTGSCPAIGSGMNLGDGKYTVYYRAGNGNGVNDTPNGEVADWADDFWYTGFDHTPGDTNGRMAIFNASADPGIFYTAQIKGALANIPITYSFWAINLDRTDASGIETRLRPNIKVEFQDLQGNILKDNLGNEFTITTGDIPPTNASNPDGDWYNFTANLNLGVTEFQVVFKNNVGGGLGNDLAIDDIEIRQTLCDTDGDGVADIFDLDSDNDGIPDAIESHPEIAKLSEGKATLTNVSTWVDANGNGMHDTTEGYTPIDSDGDGIPDYLDLDSDNDGLFDVDEYGVISSNAPTNFQNGDGDISGNGVGDGAETEAFREKDSEGDGSIEYYGDGILDIFDYHNSADTYAYAYGNIGQGTAPLYALDSDGDGDPDYRDPINGTINDIDTVEIYAHLPNTNGVLDDTTDADGDGIMASRDGDDSVFGSPRNLNDSYSLYFDGRNDYVEDTNLIASGSASLMAFVKLDGANTNGDDRFIAGQDDLYIKINDADNSITAISEGIILNSTTIVPDGIWTHIAITSENGSDIVLYINGIEEDRDTSGAGGINSTSNFMIGSSVTNSNYFKGDIDEVRVFDKALSTEELKRMVYQELDDTNNFNSGKIIPLNISASLGSNLVKYYKMDAYHDDVLDDKKTAAIDLIGAKMYNFKNIYFQRAPLPYETIADGKWTDSTNWLNGNEWDISTKQNNPEGASIVHIKNNINLNGTYNTQGMVGLIVDSENEFSIEANKGLYNSWYLKLDGLIDLDDESQLVQTEGSILDVTSAGTIERDQQGTKDYFTYNYWSSPVGVSNTSSNNNSYKMTDNVLKNGTLSISPNNINFSSSGYNGSISGDNITIADYWIWKYSNQTYNNYYAWQHVRRNGTILAGEGFTMKGVANTYGHIDETQNYVFDGKPNNGDITLKITVNNEYLVGNPYPSALDADEFIMDNISNLETNGRNPSGNVINGALYFWEHFASNSHILREYQGGYGVYTLMGGTQAINNDTRINHTGSLTSLKGAPERYIPVGQGFFVRAILDPELTGTSEDPELSSSIDGGDIIFKNSQRVFQTEASGSSIFLKSNEVKSTKKTNNTNFDTRPKLRLMFDSPKGYHRQILSGVDKNASNLFDLGYDAPLTEDNVEDMFWLIQNKEFLIQAVNHFEPDQKLPLGIKINKAGMATIRIDALENIANNLNIYLHDKSLNVYQNLRELDYKIHLDPGRYLDRFEITFGKEETLNTNNSINDKIGTYFSNDKNSIIINNPTSIHIETIETLNILGQSVLKLSPNTNQNNLEHHTHLKSGNYILRIKTEHGNITKKVLIK